VCDVTCIFLLIIRVWIFLLFVVAPMDVSCLCDESCIWLHDRKIMVSVIPIGP
jgi:hypothetical protein